MPNDSSTSGKVRLTLDLSESVNEQLSKVVKETGKTKSDLMRLALEFLLTAQKAKADNMTVGAWKDDERKKVRIEREFLGL